MARLLFLGITLLAVAGSWFMLGPASIENKVLVVTIVLLVPLTLPIVVIGFMSIWTLFAVMISDLRAPEEDKLLD